MAKFEFSDPTDAMAGPSYRQERSKQPSGIVIHFRHVPTGLTCEFKAFIEDYQDTFESEWNTQDVFGRMDDIQTFKRTKRVISISWTVPSHSEEEAISNFNEIAKMNTMQYPVYEDLQNKNHRLKSSDVDVASDIQEIKKSLAGISKKDDEEVRRIQGFLNRVQKSILSSNQENAKMPMPNQQVSLLSSPPIIQMKFMNWAADSDDDGLFGTLQDFQFKPNLDEGVFIRDGLLIPMSCACSVTFTVIHTDKLGWDRNKDKRTQNFPYQTNKLGNK